MNERSSDEEIAEYTNNLYYENAIRYHEDSILNTMRIAYEENKSEEPSQQWKDFSDYVIKRRNLKDKP